MDTPGAIFISYRRADSADIAGRIYDQLAARFGAARVFKDVDSIPPGVAFADYIVQAIGRSAVALVIIGPRWLDATSGRKRRLDDPADFVRLEIETALRLGLTIIPLLVTGATMPPAQRLPTALRDLAGRNALPARPDPDFHHDMARVIASIEYWLERPRPAPPAAPPSATPAAPTVSPPQPAPVTLTARPGPSTSPAASLVVPVTAPGPAPVGARGRPVTPRPRALQPLLAAAALLIVMTLLGVTLQALGAFSSKGSSSLPAAARTATALAATELAESPTHAYGPIAPGSCDTGALKGDWTPYLENGHVRCVSGKAVVTGPAILDFTGNGGLNANSLISVTMANFSATSSSAGVTLSPAFNGLVHGVRPLPFSFQVFADGRYITSYFGVDARGAPGHLAGPSGRLKATANGAHQISIAFYPATFSWKLFADGALVTTFIYPARDIAGTDTPQIINPLDILVDKGVSVTLSDFQVALAP